MLWPTSWLFVRGDQSIWIFRPNSNDLLVSGPGPTRLRCGFHDDAGPEMYQAEIASELTAAGWLLLGEGYDRRRKRSDRRRAPRVTPDRRNGEA